MAEEGEFEKHLRALPPGQFAEAVKIVERVKNQKDGGEFQRTLSSASDQDFHKVAADEIRKAERAKAAKG